jgi:gliding motility-associated-like protein
MSGMNCHYKYFFDTDTSLSFSAKYYYFGVDRLNFYLPSVKIVCESFILQISARSFGIFFCIPTLLLLFSSTCRAQQVTWGLNLGSAGIDYSQHSTLDPAGNVLVCGEFRGMNIDFDPSPSTTALHSSSGQCDGFVAKYTSNGQYLLSITIGGGDLDKVEAVCSDASGNIYISGFFRGPNVDFDPSPSISYLMTSNGEGGGDPGYGGDMFLAKYTSTGQFVWAFHVGGTSLGDNGLTVKTDASGNIYVGGYFKESIDFDPSALTATLSSSNGTAFLAKYNTNGQYQWALNFGGADVDNTVYDVEVDASNVYIVGFFQGSNIDFDPSPAVSALSSAGNFDIYVAKYTSSGQYQFAFRMGSSGTDVARGITLDNSSNIYIVGDFNGNNLDFDPSGGTALISSNGGSDVFIAKYSAIGLYLWAVNVGSGGSEIGWNIATDNTNVFVTGGFSGVSDFNPTSVIDNMTSNGGWDIFLAKYLSDGTYQCAFNIGSSGDDYGVDIEIAGNDRFYLAGGFVGINVDFMPGQSIYSLNSNGNRDAFLAKYYWPSNVLPTGNLIGDTICGNETAQLTFNSLTGASPFTIVYSDGTNNYTQSNVQSGVPFNLVTSPAVTTTYTVVMIQDAVRCSPINNSPGIDATVLVGNLLVRTNNDTVVCKATAVQLDATGAQTYSWSPSSGLSNPSIANPVATIQAPRQYIVTGTAANGCIGKDTVNIGVYSPPSITITDDTLVCKNTSVQLSVSGGQTYSWTPAGSLDNPNTTTPIASPSVNTLYFVNIIDNNNCQHQDSVLVSVRPDAIFKVSSPSEICINKSAQMLATGGDTYLWQPPDGLSQSDIANPLALPAVTTTYSVTIIENVCSQSQTLSTTIKVNPQPLVSVTKSNDIDCSNDQSQLNASGALQYNWFPVISLNNPFIANPVATPNSTTDYVVIGTDSKGCSDTANINVKVIADNKGKYLVPSAFTPNNDGLNDCFRVSRWGLIQKMDLRIYNRWGEMVFFATDPNECWDGTFKGVRQESGVFVYWIRASSNCDPSIFRKGTLVLIR